MRIITCIFLSLAISVCVIGRQASSLPLLKWQDTRLNNIVEFLNTNQELRKHYSCRFTGEFVPIPEDLQVELNHSFPKNRFFIAKMEVYLDPPPKLYNLVLITDSMSGKVVGFIWGFRWTMPSKSFERLLEENEGKSKEEALNRIKTLAKLLAYTGNGTVGKAAIQKNKMIVELLWGDEIFRTLEAKIDDDFRLAHLIIKRQDGKRIE